MIAASDNKTNRRAGQGFLAGSLIGVLGGLIGLGGAEFRLPVLVGMFRLALLDAVIMNKAMSLVLVCAALLFRSGEIPWQQLTPHLDVVLNLLAGSLIGAWYAAGQVLRMPRHWLQRLILLLLVGLGLLMLAESVFGLHSAGAPLIANAWLQMFAGLLAGLLIGMVAALLGVAGGELLIPTLVLLYGLDIKLAGSLSLMISLPTMLVGFARFSRSSAFAVLARERLLLVWMSAGSILGAAIGGLLLGWVPTHLLLGALGVILLISAWKTFKHAH